MSSAVLEQPIRKTTTAPYVGVWRRLTLETPDAPPDTTTQVIWLQTGSLYADLRVPAGRPDFTGVRSLAECSEKQRAWLRRQQGFAGTLAVSGSACRWRREIDYQTPGASPDEGRMAFQGDLLIEYGIHAPYREEWQRVQPASRDVLALRLETELLPDGGRRPRSGMLLALGDYFMLVLDREPLPDDAGPRARRLHRLALEVSFGRRRGPRPWEILLSTLPWREGERVIVRSAEPHLVTGDDCIQHCPDDIPRLWSVHERGTDFRWFD